MAPALCPRLCSVLENYTTCLRLAGNGRKTYFKLFKHSTELTANSSNATNATLR